MQFIITAAGSGNRFSSAGYNLPKHLLPFDEKQNILDKILNCAPAEVDKLVISNKTHYKKTQENTKGKCTFKQIDDHKNGPVFTLSQSREGINNDEVLISYCDFVSFFNFKRFEDFKNQNDFDAIIFSYTGFHPNFLTNENPAFIQKNKNEVLKIQEKKPFTDNKEEELASDGLYYFKSKDILLECIDECLFNDEFKVNNEFYVTALCEYLIKNHYKVGYFLVDFTITLGTPLFYEEYLKWSSINLYKEKIKLDCPLYITAAGEGVRFDKKDKPFLRLNGKTFLEQSINNFNCDKGTVLGIREDQKKHNAKFENIVYFNKTTKGPAETLKKMLDKKEPSEDKGFFVNGCDYLVEFDQDHLEKLLLLSPDAIISVSNRNFFAETHPKSFSWAQIKKREVERMFTKEYPFKNESPYKNFMYTGFTWFKNKNIFLAGYKNLKHQAGEIYIESVIQELITSGKTVLALSSSYYGFGTPQELNCFNFWLNFLRIDKREN
jgi:bifunctional N-acetylglucosamine-1-phosphate-uridyltransferase/glucosamine-1-phosphate-acetyltransferase GlmU-like protein